MRQVRRSRGRRDRGVLGIGLALLVVALLTGVLLGVNWTQGLAAPGAILAVDAPARVRVGQSIEMTIYVKNASDIAGYEVNLAFDTGAAHLNDLRQRQNDLKKLGRDVHAVGPVYLDTGVTFGAYSCPVSDCTQPVGKARKDKGGHGMVKMGTVVLVPDRAGTLSIDFHGTTFVDSNGNPVAVDLSATPINVQVEEVQ